MLLVRIPVGWCIARQSASAHGCSKSPYENNNRNPRRPVSQRGRICWYIGRGSFCLFDTWGLFASSSGKFFLDLIKRFSWNNGWMVILNVILRKLSVILLDLSLQKVRGVGFWSRTSPAYFSFAGFGEPSASSIEALRQDLEYRLSPAFLWFLACCRHSESFARSYESFPHPSEWFLALHRAPSEMRIRCSEKWISLACSPCDSLGNITADGFTLGLGKGAQAGQNHLAVHVWSIDVFFFKYNRDPPAFEDSDVLDTIKGVSGKSGDGFC